jgi:hypothetical protein
LTRAILLFSTYPIGRLPTAVSPTVVHSPLSLHPTSTHYSTVSLLPPTAGVRRRLQARQLVGCTSIGVGTYPFVSWRFARQSIISTAGSCTFGFSSYQLFLRTARSRPHSLLDHPITTSTQPLQSTVNDALATFHFARHEVPLFTVFRPNYA